LIGNFEKVSKTQIYGALFSVSFWVPSFSGKNPEEKAPKLRTKSKTQKHVQELRHSAQFFCDFRGHRLEYSEKKQKRTLLRIKVKNVEKLFVGTSYVQTSSKTALLIDGVGKLQVKSAKAEVEAMRAEMKELKAPKWFPSKSLMSNSQPSAFLTLQERFLHIHKAPWCPPMDESKKIFTHLLIQHMLHILSFWPPHRCIAFNSCCNGRQSFKGLRLPGVLCFFAWKNRWR